MTYMKSRSVGYSLAFSMPSSVPFFQGWQHPLLPGQEATELWFAQTLILPCISKAEARERVVQRLVLSPPGLVLKQYRGFLIAHFFWFWGWGWGFFCITVSSSGYGIFARKRRTCLTSDLSVAPGWFCGWLCSWCRGAYWRAYLPDAGKIPAETQKPYKHWLS